MNIQRERLASKYDRMIVQEFERVTGKKIAWKEAPTRTEGSLIERVDLKSFQSTSGEENQILLKNGSIIQFEDIDAISTLKSLGYGIVEIGKYR